MRAMTTTKTANQRQSRPLEWSSTTQDNDNTNSGGLLVLIAGMRREPARRRWLTLIIFGTILLTVEGTSSSVTSPGNLATILRKEQNPQQQQQLQRKTQQNVLKQDDYSLGESSTSSAQIEQQQKQQQQRQNRWLGDDGGDDDDRDKDRYPGTNTNTEGGNCNRSGGGGGGGCGGGSNNGTPNGESSGPNSEFCKEYYFLPQCQLPPPTTEDIDDGLIGTSPYPPPAQGLAPYYPPPTSGTESGPASGGGGGGGGGDYGQDIAMGRPSNLISLGVSVAIIVEDEDDEDEKDIEPKTEASEPSILEEESSGGFSSNGTTQQLEGTGGGTRKRSSEIRGSESEDDDKDSGDDEDGASIGDNNIGRGGGGGEGRTEYVLGSRLPSIRAAQKIRFAKKLVASVMTDILDNHTPFEFTMNPWDPSEFGDYDDSDEGDWDSKMDNNYGGGVVESNGGSSSSSSFIGSSSNNNNNNDRDQPFGPNNRDRSRRMLTRQVNGPTTTTAAKATPSKSEGHTDRQTLHHQEGEDVEQQKQDRTGKSYDPTSPLLAQERITNREPRHNKKNLALPPKLFFSSIVGNKEENGHSRDFSDSSRIKHRRAQGGSGGNGNENGEDNGGSGGNGNENGEDNRSSDNRPPPKAASMYHSFTDVWPSQGVSPLLSMSNTNETRLLIWFTFHVHYEAFWWENDKPIHNRDKLDNISWAGNHIINSTVNNGVFLTQLRHEYEKLVEEANAGGGSENVNQDESSSNEYADLIENEITIVATAIVGTENKWEESGIDSMADGSILDLEEHYRVYNTPLSLEDGWGIREWLGLGLFATTLLVSSLLTACAYVQKRRHAQHEAWGTHYLTEQGVRDLLQVGWRYQTTANGSSVARSVSSSSQVTGSGRIGGHGGGRGGANAAAVTGTNAASVKTKNKPTITEDPTKKKKISQKKRSRPASSAPASSNGDGDQQVVLQIFDKSKLGYNDKNSMLMGGVEGVMPTTTATTLPSSTATTASPGDQSSYQKSRSGSKG